jgi:hypothetical protein
MELRKQPANTLLQAQPRPSRRHEAAPSHILHITFTVESDVLRHNPCRGICEITLQITKLTRLVTL